MHEGGGTADGIDADKPTTTAEVPWRPGHPSQLRLAASSGAAVPGVCGLHGEGAGGSGDYHGPHVNEPAGKKTYLGGLLTWRKLTTQAVAAPTPDRDYNGSWMGAVSGKLVSVSATHVLGSPTPVRP